MRSSILCFFALFIFTSCGAQKKEKIAGNKEVKTLTKDIDADFLNLEIDDDIEVTVKQGRTTNYVLTADENLVPEISIDVRGNTLYIKTEKQITNSKKLRIYLTVNSLTGILLKNGAKLRSDGLLSLQALALTAQQSSRFDLDLETESLEVNLLDKSGGDLNVETEQATLLMNGRTDLDAEFKVREFTVALQKRAKLKLNGKAKEAMISVNDAVSFRARHFEVDDAEISMADKADVEIKVSDNLSLYAKDRSIINLYGNPKLDVKGLDDKARINKK